VNEEGQADLNALGVRLIVDCRSKVEAAELPDAPWVISGARYVALDLPKPTDHGASSCSETLAGMEPKLAMLFSHLGDPRSMPALIHCGIGRERSCLLMTVLMLALGVSPALASEDFAKNQAFPADPRWLDALFTRVADQGGIDRYLAAHSVARADLESFRQRAVE
jgi:protein-tyrosine phosphatase